MKPSAANGYLYRWGCIRYGSLVHQQIIPILKSLISAQDSFGTSCAQINYDTHKIQHFEPNGTVNIFIQGHYD